MGKHNRKCNFLWSYSQNIVYFHLQFVRQSIHPYGNQLKEQKSAKTVDTVPTHLNSWECSWKLRRVSGLEKAHPFDLNISSQWSACQLSVMFSATSSSMLLVFWPPTRRVHQEEANLGSGNRNVWWWEDVQVWKLSLFPQTQHSWSFSWSVQIFLKHGSNFCPKAYLLRNMYFKL